MAPVRPLKRQKTNPTDEASATPIPPSQVPLPPDTPTSPSGPSTTETPSTESNRSSWYSRTWPRKAPPVTQIARDSISSGTNAAAEVASIVKDKVTPKPKATRSPSLAMTLGKTKSTRALPADATTTKIHATSQEPKSPSKSSSQLQFTDRVRTTERRNTLDGQQKRPDQATSNGSIVQTNPDEGKSENKLGSVNQGLVTDNKSGWLPWVSTSSLALKSAPETVPDTTAANPAQQTAPPSAPVIESAQNQATEADQSQKDQDQKEAPQQPSSNKRSWLQMWSNDTPSRPETPPPPSSDADIQKSLEAAKSSKLDVPAPGTSSKSATPSKASSIETSPPPALPGDSTKSSGWVFWSSGRKDNASASTGDRPHVGEIAISDTPSQSHPRRTSISLPEEKIKSEIKVSQQADQFRKAAAAKSESIKSGQTEETSSPKGAKKAEPKQDQTVTKAEGSNATAIAREPKESLTPRPASPAPSRRGGENLLLPPFTETLSLQENPSILQQLARLLYYNKEPDLKHLSLVRDPPRIRNALAIGVHGYFPAPLIRSVLGQPTGTSIKFADMAAKSIKAWTRGRGYDCQVKTAALEGEGKIAERIELLWKLLLNWIEEIRKSDFVMVACHSQGVPVAMMLVAKLIHFGCVNAAKVGICAMAGVNMGPFPELKSRWISGSAGELFEFSDPESKVSVDYRAALETVLRFGVRTTFIGSIDDQLVSLESSIFAPITHPHIYRAVLIDSRVHAPGFLSHLVGFALKLRNLGVQDHGLIRELSSPLAGSLYTGEGHSRIYEDESVYDLAVSFALETTELPNVPIMQKPIVMSGPNPYILPFAMRGILEEDFVKTELQHEAQELLKQFDDWKPTTKVMKDVKFRLEGIRSKL